VPEADFWRINQADQSIAGWAEKLAAAGRRGRHDPAIETKSESERDSLLILSFAVIVI
jgi:hypothetical protein